MTVTLTPSTDPRFPDKETQEIVEKMEKEGHKPLDAKDEPEQKEQPEQKPEEPKEPEAKKEEEPTGDEKKEDDEPEVPDRKILSIPVGQVKKEKKELERAIRAEAQAQIDDLTRQIESLKTQTTGQSPATEAKITQGVDRLQTWIKTLQDKHQVDPALAQDLLTAAREIVADQALPKDLAEKVSRIDSVQKELEEEKLVAAENNRFEEEFSKEIIGNENIKQSVEASGLTLDQFYTNLYEFVYSEKGTRYRNNTLSEIFMLRKSDLLPTRKKSAESSRGGSTVGETGSDPMQLPSAEEIGAMSPAEFEKFSNDMAKRSKSTLMRGGKEVR